jgi:hypothetical protein
VRGQPSALVDPVPNLKWIRGIQALRRFGIGHPATVGADIPGGVESEPGAGGHAYPVTRNSPENDGASRGTITIDDHPLARGSHALISVDVGSDVAAGVIRYPNRCVANTVRLFMTIPVLNRGT